MSKASDPSMILKMVESGIRSAIPWSRQYPLDSELSQLHQSMQKSIEVNSRLKNIQQSIRQKTIQDEKSLSNSMLMSQQRRNKIIEDRKKHVSQHTKKVTQKLKKYQTTQKIQLKKSEANQKRFSQTINQYWRVKTQQNQSRQKKIFRQYASKKQSRQTLQSSQVMLTQQIQFYDDYSVIRGQTKLDSVMDRGEQVRSRLQQINAQKYGQSFQKMMRKLARIQRRKQFQKLALGKTQQKDDSQKQEKAKHYVKRRPKIVFKQKPLMSTTMIVQKKRLPSRYQQYYLNRKIQQEQAFDEHTSYLQDYRFRVKQLDNIKELRQKIIEAKIYVKRKQLRSKSHL